MKRIVTCLTALALPLLIIAPAQADDPFAGGADALAVKDSDGSASLRAKKKLTRMDPDMIQIQVTAVDDARFPHCVFSGKVLKEATDKDRHFKLIGRGKVYRFEPELKMSRGKTVDLSDEMTQNNLGACYYPAKTTLVVKVGGVDRRTKLFKASAIYLK